MISLWKRFKTVKISVKDLEMIEKEILTKNEIIQKQSETIKELLKYKEQDKILESYEKHYKKLNNKCKELESENKELKNLLFKYIQKFKHFDVLESLYLDKIIKLKNQNSRDNIRFSIRTKANVQEFNPVLNKEEKQVIRKITEIYA